MTAFRITTLRMIQGNTHGVASFDWIECLLCVSAIVMLAVPFVMAWRETRKDKEQGR